MTWSPTRSFAHGRARPGRRWNITGPTSFVRCSTRPRSTGAAIGVAGNARRQGALRIVHEPGEHLDSIDAERALAHLSPQQRAVAYLAYWYDQTPLQIAELLGVREGTVRKQRARAREHLRRILDA